MNSKRTGRGGESLYVPIAGAPIPGLIIHNQIWQVRVHDVRLIVVDFIQCHFFLVVNRERDIRSRNTSFTVDRKNVGGIGQLDSDVRCNGIDRSGQERRSFLDGGKIKN